MTEQARYSHQTATVRSEQAEVGAAVEPGLSLDRRDRSGGAAVRKCDAIDTGMCYLLPYIASFELPEDLTTCPLSN